MLEGKKVNIRLAELNDIPMIHRWSNDPSFGGEYESLQQTTLNDLEKWFEEKESDTLLFLIEDKKGTPIGQIFQTMSGGHPQIGYILLPSERGKGYCTDAVALLIDYLFLNKNYHRIQAKTNPLNIASIRVLEKNGFTYEGTVRKDAFIMGEWMDGNLYSILREEWGEPRIL